MLELYHFPHAICAQKVRVALAEKGLDWVSCDVLGALRSPRYLELNPSGYVPTLVHDGRVVTESRVISEYLEDAFPAPPLLPADPFARARVRLWTKQIDDSLHLNVFAMTFINFARPRFLAMTGQEAAAELPLDQPVKRQWALDLIDQGFASPYFDHAVRRFAKLLADMEAALAEGPWLAGEAYSLADADYTPYLRRLEDLGLWALARPAHPRVEAWFARLRERPSYRPAILDWVTPQETERLARAAAEAEPHLRERWFARA